MALDEMAKGLLDAFAAGGVKSFEQMSVSEARAAAAAFGTLQTDAPPLAAVENLTIPGGDGEVPIRIYVPEGEGPFPVILYFHGGGWVIGSHEVVDKPCAKLAAEAGAVVVSAQYRLAPETKFPGPIDDAYGALKWVAESIARYQGNPGKLAVAGDSAGGNIAAALAIKARDEDGPRISAQILIYPVTDGPDSNFPSRKENAEGYLLTSAAMDWFWGHYLRDAKDGTHPYASPLLCDDHAGLPPALVLTMEFDPLRDEGEAYADKLAASGVSVTRRRYDGLIHGTLWATAAIPRSQEMFDAISGFVHSELS